MACVDQSFLCECERFRRVAVHVDPHVFDPEVRCLFDPVPGLFVWNLEDHSVYRVLELAEVVEDSVAVELV